MVPAINWRAFAVLAFIDILFVAIYIWLAVYQPEMRHGRFSIYSDRAFPEMFGYLKWAGVVFLLFMYHSRVTSKLCLAFALIFLIILLDDSLEIHENFGALVVGIVGEGSIMGLRHKDYGELLYFLIFGLFAIYAIFRSYPPAPKEEKSFARTLLYLIVGLAMFGVVLDMWHIGLWGVKDYGHVLGVLEDTGEQIMSALIFAYIFGSLYPVLRRTKSNPEAS